ncbi:hypothetical protein Barb6_02486 [Bacteroidales bacterium Barb6]|nr:hypothetical protein Barb6_02486 [Bacteroidales bacterium Barb6]
MYTPGNILYFTPFHFPNGKSKDKYFLVLAHDGDDLITVSLPTSKDHIPNFLNKKHGCINDDQNKVNCYYFEGGKIISECRTFAFPLDTYVYGEQAHTLSASLLKETYKNTDTDYKILGRLSDSEFKSLKQCLMLSGSLKRGIRKRLEE